MPQAPDTENVRQIKQSGTRWRYRDIPNRYLGIGKTNEAQEMFDSGYIGDDGLGNQDLRTHVYYGNLILDTAKDTGQSISILANLDNIIESGRHTRLDSKGNLNISAANNITVSITGNKKETINGSVDTEINGVDGYSLSTQYNYTENIGNNYKSTVGQSYNSTVGLDAQYNSRNTTINTSESFNVSSNKDVNVSSKQNIDIGGSNQVRVNSTGDVLLEGRNLGANIIAAINVSCNDMILRASEDFNSQINGNYVQSVGKSSSYSTTGSYSNVSRQLTIKSNKMDFDTKDNNGAISFQFGSGSLSMNSSTFTTPNNSKLMLSTEFEATKVWKAVYN